jgi:hypothetical protein
MSVLTGSRHLGDEDLVRYMDRQLDHEGTRLMGAHLRTCAECAERLEGWQHKAAAVLVVGIGLATEPGRAFVAEGIVRTAGNEPGSAAARLLEWLGQEPPLAAAPAGAPADQVALERVAGNAIPTAPVPAAPLTAGARAPARPRLKPGMSAPLRFSPDGPDVTLTFASMQGQGTATLWIRDVPHASVQAVAGYHAEEMQPTPGGLEVAKSTASRADYVITVPTRYRFIRVRVGDTPEVLIRISKSKQDWIWTINLQNSALQ